MSDNLTADKRTDWRFVLAVLLYALGLITGYCLGLTS